MRSGNLRKGEYCHPERNEGSTTVNLFNESTYTCFYNLNIEKYKKGFI